MPDISMCKQTACDSRHNCYRYLAVPKKHGQKYKAYDNANPSPCAAFLWVESDSRVFTVEQADEINKQGAFK